jgi:hypothetical protein
MCEREDIKHLLCQLNSRPKSPFPPSGQRINAPKTQGVYVIRNPAGEVLHVGRTLRGKDGLSQRLNNHLRGQSSFVRAHFNGDGNTLRDGCTFQYLEVDDDPTRALLEHCAVCWLCPHYLGLGASRSTESR